MSSWEASATRCEASTSCNSKDLPRHSAPVSNADSRERCWSSKNLKEGRPAGPRGHGTLNQET